MPAPGCRLQQTSLAGRPPSAHSTLATVAPTLWYWVPTPMASWTPPLNLSRNRAETQGADLPWASLNDSPQETSRLWILSSLFRRIQELPWVLNSSGPDTVEKVGSWGAAPQPQQLSTFTHNGPQLPAQHLHQQREQQEQKPVCMCTYITKGSVVNVFAPHKNPTRKQFLTIIPKFRKWAQRG